MKNGTASPPVDMDRLRRRFDNDETLLAEIFRVFRAEAPGRREAMEAALAAGSLDQLTRQAHSLKGVAGTMFADPLHAAAYELELAARSGGPDCPRLMRTVLARMEEVARFVEAV